MERIGIRELRQHASRWVAKAKAGTAIVITDRGQPVARLVPLSPAEQTRDALIADGLLQPASRSRGTLSTDNLVAGPSITVILEDLRSDR
jgi:prevent-host-death family protein